MCITLHIFLFSIHFANIKNSVCKIVLRNAIIKYKTPKTTNQRKPTTKLSSIGSSLYSVSGSSVVIISDNILNNTTY